jgi:hypothetical protein
MQLLIRQRSDLSKLDPTCPSSGNNDLNKTEEQLLLFKTKKKKTLPNARRSAVETLKKTRPI